MAHAAPAGLTEFNINRAFNDAQKRIKSELKRGLWSGNSETIGSMVSDIISFCHWMEDDLSILRNELIPKIRTLIDMGDQVDERYIKAIFSDFELSSTYLDIEFLRNKEPKSVVDDLDVFFEYLLRLIDTIGEYIYTDEILELPIDKGSIETANTRFHIDTLKEKARP